MTNDRQHWDGAYQAKAADQVSWYGAHLDVSFQLLVEAGLGPHSRIVDVGGGASTLVDDLLDFGVEAMTVRRSLAGFAGNRATSAQRAG